MEAPSGPETTIETRISRLPSQAARTGGKSTGPSRGKTTPQDQVPTIREQLSNIDSYIRTLPACVPPKPARIQYKADSELQKVVGEIRDVLVRILHYKVPKA